MKAQRRICLQITLAAVRRVEMVWRDGSWSYMRTDSRPLPFIDAVKDPLSHPALAGAVRELLAGVKPPVFVSISTSEVLLRWIELPSAIPDVSAALQDMAVATVLENESYIPIPLNAAAYDYQLMTPGTLLVGWMRKSKLSSFLAELNGVKLVYLTPQPVTLANQLRSEWGMERVCGVHVDGAQCDLAVVEGDELCLGRSFFYADFNELWRTVQQSLANCPNRTGTPLKRIVLFGEAVALSREFPAKQLGLEVTTATFDWHAALLGPIDTGFTLNLLASELAKRAALRKMKRKRRLIWLIAVTATLLLAVANVKLYEAVESAQLRNDGMRRDREQADRLRSETKSLQEQYAVHEAALAELAWVERRFPSLSKRLVQIANQRSGTVRLTEIRSVPRPQSKKADAGFDARRALVLVGVAPNQAEINAFRASLAIQPEFTSVRQVKTEQTLIGGEKWLEFTLAVRSTEGER